MNPFSLLIVAVVAEVFASSMLKLSEGFKRLLPSLGVIGGYAIAFYCLSLALQSFDLGIAYAIWAGLGTALTAIIGVLAYKEKLNGANILGLLCIVGGVVVLNFVGGGH